MFFKQEFGIDFGTDTIKIYDKKNDHITIEKNLIVTKEDTVILGAGNNARDMINRTAENTRALVPVSGGRINNIRYTEALLHILLFNQGHYLGHRPSIYFAIPYGMTEIEKRAYASVARRGKLRDCSIYIIEKPISDALALGISVRKTKGSMIINVGASGAELSVIADSNIILNNTIKFGGRFFDESIISAVRKKNNLKISQMFAEDLKIKISDKENTEKIFRAEGIDSLTGLPREGFVSLSTIKNAMFSAIKDMSTEIKIFLERVPPQVRRVISQEAIVLTGGGSRIEGLDEILEDELRCPVILSSLYQYCTVSGLKELITHADSNIAAYNPLKRD